MLKRDDILISNESEHDHRLAAGLLKSRNLFYFFTTKEVGDYHLPREYMVPMPQAISHSTAIRHARFCLWRIDFDNKDLGLWAYLYDGAKISNEP